VIVVPIRTGRGQNSREHHMARARRVRSERNAVGWSLRAAARPIPPCTVLLTRIAPSQGLDDDNLSGSLKAARDAVAEWLGVDDRHTEIVRYRYAQERGPWAVRIEVLP
jgi:hypothetical protein